MKKTRQNEKPHETEILKMGKYLNSGNTEFEEALEQIKNNQYADCLKGYNGEVLLVGINYDKKTKKHSCSIEKMKI